MAATVAAQALASHKGIPYMTISDSVASASFCCEQIGAPAEDLFRRITELGYVELTEEVLNDRQHDAVQSGLSASGEVVALVESIIDA